MGALQLQKVAKPITPQGWQQQLLLSAKLGAMHHDPTVQQVQPNKIKATHGTHKHMCTSQRGERHVCQNRGRETTHTHTHSMVQRYGRAGRCRMRFQLLNCMRSLRKCVHERSLQHAPCNRSSYGSDSVLVAPGDPGLPACVALPRQRTQT